MNDIPPPMIFRPLFFSGTFFLPSPAELAPFLISPGCREGVRIRFHEQMTGMVRGSGHPQFFFGGTPPPNSTFFVFNFSPWFLGIEISRSHSLHNITPRLSHGAVGLVFGC